jgi:restriction endonuclease S subunit
MNGICSAHAMVVRAKPDMVLPEFLPFLMMSDKFMNRAVEISVGSLSPTINWTTLKLQEFDLPPLDQQRRIAEILWGVEVHKSLMEATLAKFQLTYDGFANEHLASAKGSLTKLGELSRRGELDIQTGPFGTVLQASSYSKVGTPIINPVNMRKHRLWVDDGPFLDDKECERLSRYRMKIGDILLGRKGDVGRAVRVTPAYDGYIVGSDILRLRLINARILPDYLYYFIRAPRTRAWIARHASGTTMPGINEKILNSLEMPIPSPGEQAVLVQAVEQMNQAEDALNKSIAASANLIVALTNHLT